VRLLSNAQVLSPEGVLSEERLGTARTVPSTTSVWDTFGESPQRSGAGFLAGVPSDSPLQSAALELQQDGDGARPAEAVAVQEPTELTPSISSVELQGKIAVATASLQRENDTLVKQANDSKQAETEAILNARLWANAGVEKAALECHRRIQAAEKARMLSDAAQKRAERRAGESERLATASAQGAIKAFTGEYENKLAEMAQLALLKEQHFAAEIERVRGEADARSAHVEALLEEADHDTAQAQLRATTLEEMLKSREGELEATTSVLAELHVAAEQDAVRSQQSEQLATQVEKSTDQLIAKAASEAARAAERKMVSMQELVDRFAVERQDALHDKQVAEEKLAALERQLR